MPRCGCQDACSCLIVAGDGISVEGIGTLENPYQITSESSDLTGRLVFTDEGNVDFTATGVGTLNDPTTVFADALLAVKDLTDTPDTDPAEGQVLVWRDDHWEYEAQSGSGGGTGLPPGGIDGQVLTKQSNADGDADWETFQGGSGVVDHLDYVVLRANAPQTMTSGTETTITFAAATSDDPLAMWDGAGTVTVQRDGLYEIIANFSYMPVAAAGSRINIVRINGATYKQWYETHVSGLAQFSTHAFTIRLNAGDTIYMRQYQSSGSNLDTYGGSIATCPALSVTRLPENEPGGGGVVVDRPAFGAWYRSGNQTLVNNAATQVIYDTVNVQAPQGMSIDASGTVTVLEAGLYMITAHLSFAPSNVGNRYGYLYAGTPPNGTNLGRVMTATNTLSGGYSGLVLAQARWLEAGDVIRVLAYQNSGGNLDLFNDTTNRASGLEVTRIPSAYSGSAVSTYGERNYASARRHLAATSIPNNAWTNVPLDTPAHEDGITWNGTEFVVPVAGYYTIDAAAAFLSGASGASGRGVSIRVNGSQVANVNTSNQTATPGQGVSVTWRCSAGDTIGLYVWQNTGAALTLQGGLPQNTYMSVTKVPAPVINGAAVSGAWGVGTLSKTGSDPNFGDLIYIDGRGQLRGQPQALSTSVYPKVNADLAGTYPIGMTIVQMTGAQSSAGGWPEGVSGSVVTFRRSGEVDADACASQWYYVTTSSRPRAYYRSCSGTGAANKWSPWVKVTDSEPPRTARRKSTSQTLAASTWTNVTFDIDVESNTSIPYANGVFTIPEDGVYQVNAMLLFGGLAAGNQQRMRILVDASSIAEQAQNTSYSGDALTMSRSWRMLAGQTFTIGAWANAAGNVTGSGVSYTVMDITKISA